MSKKKSNRNVKQSGSGRSKANELLDPPRLDRRAIEGLMRQLVSGMSDTDSEIDAAQQIMYQAFDETNPRRQMGLARKALEISPDCADAYVLLAEYAPLTERLELYKQGVAAGERALGKDGFQEYEGHFWGFLETRPYMRAREGLANCLWESGQRAEAAEHCREMLRLNPNDNQGIRYRLASMLLDLEQHDELDRLLQEYEDDASAEWAYNRALSAFRREGDSASARRSLADAKQVNSHVPAYLAGARPMPREMADYITPGGEDEAVGYAAQFLPAWKDTPGAISWLRRTLKISAAAGLNRKQDTWAKVRPALARLPQCEVETWQVDLRGFVAPTTDEGDAEQHWMLIIYSTTEKLLLLEPFADRPRDSELLSVLITALREPGNGEPHRPGEICVTRKAWFRSWRPKLQQIGIECRLNDSLEQIDRWLADATPQLETALRNAGVISSADLDWSQIGALPQQAGEIWQVGIERLPAWVEVAGEPTRPWVRVVAEVESDVILATEIVPDEPGDDWLLQGVWQALNYPAVGQPHRPGVIQVASDQQRAMLSAHLEPAGVRCVANANLKHVRRIIGDLADHFSGQQHRKALVNSPGVTPAQVGRFFAAAAEFYRCRPWRQVPGDTIIRVDCERFDSSPWYAVVMGQSGVELGLALYEDVELLRTLLSGDLSDEESGRRTSAISVTYGEAFEIAPQDLDAAEDHGWPVAGPEAYPSVLRVNPGLAIRMPLKWELELLEGCLRAIPVFLGQRAGSAQIPVAISAGTTTFQLERLKDEG